MLLALSLVTVVIPHGVSWQKGVLLRQGSWHARLCEFLKLGRAITPRSLWWTLLQAARLWLAVLSSTKPNYGSAVSFHDFEVMSILSCGCAVHVKLYMLISNYA